MQLCRIELLAEGAEELAHEGIDLLPQKRILLLQVRIPSQQFRSAGQGRVGHAKATTDTAGC